jgi:hypothetical protein
MMPPQAKKITEPRKNTFRSPSGSQPTIIQSAATAAPKKIPAISS